MPTFQPERLFHKSLNTYNRASDLLFGFFYLCWTLNRCKGNRELKNTLSDSVTMACWSRRLALSICWGHLSFALCASFGQTHFWRCLAKSTNWIGFTLFWLLHVQVQDSSKFECGIDRCNLSHVWDYVTIVAIGNFCIYTQWASNFGVSGLQAKGSLDCVLGIWIFL